MAQCCGKGQANEQGGVLQQFRTHLQTQGERAKNELFFPMYVVRMEEFMKMTEARPHQTLRLEGIVTDFVFLEECPSGTFMSHQWGSRVTRSFLGAAWLSAESAEADHERHDPGRGGLLRPHRLQDSS